MPNPVRMLREKLRALLPAMGTDDLAKAVAKFGQHLKPVSVHRWLTQDVRLPDKSRTALRGFLKSHGIEITDAEWFYCDAAVAGNFCHRVAAPVAGLSEAHTDESPIRDRPDPAERLQQHREVQRLAKQGGAANFSFSVTLPVGSVLTSELVRLFTGRYLLYRYSFSDSDRGQVVSEVAYIRPVPDTNHELDVVMYCHPPPDRPKGKQRSERHIELYVGRLFRLGELYAMILHNDVGAQDRDERRLRFYMFPRVGGSRTEHYGLVMGFTPNLREPVAARVFGVKAGDQTEPDETVYDQVLRGVPNTRGGPRVTRRILNLIRNSIEREGSTILTVAQARLARESSPGGVHRTAARIGARRKKLRRRAGKNARPPRR